MPAATPEETTALVCAAVNAADVEAAMALYEPGAALALRSGDVVRGHQAIRDGFVSFLALSPAMEARVDRVVAAGDVALVCGRWRATVAGPDGAVEVAGRLSDVVRRQPDGAWLFVVDNPWAGEWSGPVTPG